MGVDDALVSNSNSFFPNIRAAFFPREQSQRRRGFWERGGSEGMAERRMAWQEEEKKGRS